VRPAVHRATRHPDVLPRRPADAVRPDLDRRARPQGPCAHDRELRHGDDRAGVGARVQVGHRARPGRPRDDAAGGRAMTLPRTPSQTVGPYYAMGLSRRDESVLEPGGVELTGMLLDGQGEPIPDGLVELWDASGRRSARCGTENGGRFRFTITK